MPPKKKATKIQKTNELKENAVPKTAKKDEENSAKITKTKTSSRTETLNDDSKKTRSRVRNTKKVESEIVEENLTNKKKSASKRKKENDTEIREEKVLRVSSRSKKTEIIEEPVTEKRTSKRETKIRVNEAPDTKDPVDEPKKGRKRATNKADEKSKIQSKRTKKVESDVSESISKRQPRATKKKTTEDEVKDEEVISEDESVVVKKKSTARKPKVEKEAKEAKALKNKTANDFESINYDCSRLNEHGKEWNLKIASWNVDGIRAWFNKGCLDYIAYEKPDIFCIQETKCSYEKLPDEIREYKGYHIYWCSADKEGYAGVGLMTKKMPLHVINGIEDPEHDSEGRVITAEFEKFYLCCVYVPNSGRGLVTMPKRLDWNEKFKKFVNDLNAKKPVIICGDMNVAHKEIDLKNPKTNKKTAGFTQEERDGMTDFLSNGYVDVFRKLYPDKEGAYTFWTYMMNSRAKNIGWRVDYFLLSERIASNVCDNVIRSEVYGSDHCPLVLFLNM